MKADLLRALVRAPELLAAASADDLRVNEELRRSWPVELVAAASEQAELRRRARAKTGDPERLLLTRAGLEQASSEVIAQHRGVRFAGLTDVVDLCCGIGFDLRALARSCEVIGVDLDEAHAVCARHNANVPVAVADVRDVRYDGVRAVFVDPARRDERGRGGSEPPVSWCVSLPVDRIAIKAAPGLDHARIPVDWEAEFVAVGRDLKEACLWSPTWATARRRATVLPAGETLVSDDSVARAEVRAPGAYVIDPSPAVTRAGLVAELAAQVRGWQVDAQIAFLCTDSPVVTPFGRSLRVEASLPFGVKPLAAELRRLDIGSIDVRRRGLAGDVDHLRRRLKPSGSRRAVVLLTRVANKPWTFVCSELPGA
jgi:hypothetical protein